MSIQIKELLPSDALSEAIGKVNYNFDQLILAGGGPEGPLGPQGIQGPNGAQGNRGSLWYESPTGGTAGANVPLSIFIKDKILDGTGEVWEYNGTSWVDTTINLTGPQGPPGTAGAGGEYLRYAGDWLGGNWVTKANGSNTPITDSNISPNFFGFYDATDGSEQGIDSFIFGHNQDVTDSTGLGATGGIPKMIILQSNLATGISIGLGSTYSTGQSLGQVDFGTHAQIYKDGMGGLRIHGAKGIYGGETNKVTLKADQSTVLLEGWNTQIGVGVDSIGGFGHNTFIGASGMSVIKGGNFSPTHSDDPIIYVGSQYVNSTNVFNYATPGNDIILIPNSTGNVAVNGNTYHKGKVIIRDSGTNHIDAGLSLFTTIGQTTGHILHKDINGTYNTNGLSLQIASRNLTLQSNNGRIILNDINNDRVLIGSDPGAAFVGASQSLGMWDENGVDFYLGTEIQTTGAGTGIPTYLKQSFHPANDGILPRHYTDYFSMSGEFRRNDTDASTYTDKKIFTISVSDANNHSLDQPRGLIGIGGVPVRWWATNYKDKLNIWGGISFKGSSIGYDTSIYHLTNVGYKAGDMVFWNYFNADVDADGVDMGLPNARSKIFFGTEGISNPHDSVINTISSNFSQDPHTNDTGWLSIFDASYSSQSAITIYSEASAENVSLGIFSRNNYSSTGVNGTTPNSSKEFLINTHGVDVAIQTTTDIILKSDCVKIANTETKKYMGFRAGRQSTNKCWTLPLNVGNPGEILTRGNGSLDLEWADAANVGGVPCNAILMWNGHVGEPRPSGGFYPDTVPVGYKLCNGSFGTPDLRERFVVGTGGKNTGYDANDGGETHNGNDGDLHPGFGVGYPYQYAGGQANHTLSIGQMPSHDHSQWGSSKFNIDGNLDTAYSPDKTVISGWLYDRTGAAGGGGSHNNLPPYYALAFIMRYCDPGDGGLLDDIRDPIDVIDGPAEETPSEGPGG